MRATPGQGAPADRSLRHLAHSFVAPVDCGIGRSSYGWRRNKMKKITPFLWFNGNAEEAMNFYLSIFKNAKAGSISRYGDAGPGPKGSVMSATFELEGQAFMALNGGPQFTFTPAISFFVGCETQEEIDGFWSRLSEGGATNRCGWLTDKFGLSWQIVPSTLGQLLGSKDPETATRVMTAMLQMEKLDIQKLKDAATK
jgi:predicted 3-demethylubiquinone-9 3-methyltransferase (glyoxalase superfamily)